MTMNKDYLPFLYRRLQRSRDSLDRAIDDILNTMPLKERQLHFGERIGESVSTIRRNNTLDLILATIDFWYWIQTCGDNDESKLEKFGGNE